MKKVRIFLSIGLALLGMSCAQVVAPTGGEKDISPPEIIEAQPPIGQLNFNEKSFTIEFDEFIKLRNINKQLLVSPPLKYDLESRIKGKSLAVEIEDTLKENTTYVINFGNAIVDITEQNPLEGFKYIFSTGSSIDSLSLSGTIVNAFDLEAQEDFNVQLYRSNAFDSLPINSLPDYVSKVDKDGNFTITNIGAGTYMLFGIKDGNDNYLFDRPDEEIAFSASPLQLDSTVYGVELFSFVEDNQNQFVEKVSTKGPMVTIIFKKEGNRMSIQDLDPLPDLKLKWMSRSKNFDTLKLWWSQVVDTDIELIVSNEIDFSDTISFKLDSLPKKQILKPTQEFKNRYAYFRPLPIEFTWPLEEIDPSKISVTRLDGKVISFEAKMSPNNAHSLQLSFKHKEDSTYRLNLLPGAATDIYGRVNDTLSGEVSFDKASDYGKLIVKLDSSLAGNRILQLTDGKSKVLRSNYDSEATTIFENLKAGQYGLKIIFDGNQNKKWDTGTFLEGKQAEECIILREKIDIRANWDKEIDWIIEQ